MEGRRPEPVGAHYDIVLNLDKPGRVVPIRIPPDDPLAAELVHLLKEYEDIIAFTVEEISGIDPTVVVHKLNVDPNVRSVRQKKRNHGEVRNQAAASEVKKLMDGLYCYKVMPFGLKNSPATFQRLINTIISKQLGRNIEAYIDDMIVKSKKRAAHMADLRETFETIRTYNMRLNPKKCVFRVTSGKFLGFLIDERGIEANPDKIQEVIDMSSPKTVKEVQRLTGCLAALGRFLSRAGDKCQYFFKRIKNKSKFEWSDEAEATFLKFKDHFHILPCLVSPLQGENAEPLKLPFTRLEAAGCMLNWAIELNEFDITYELRKAIKGQAFADFIVEMTRPVFSKNKKTAWTASNNEAEYEALLYGSRMCKAASAEEILELSDSQLIVSHVNKDYEARDPTMVKYMKAVHQEVENLKSYEVRKVPRSENNQADALSKLASSASCDTPRHVFWEVKDQKSIEQAEMTVLDRKSTWMDDIINFKMNGVLQDDQKQAAKLQKKCSWFEMWNGTLYKKSYSRPLLQCVTPEKGQEILEVIHQGCAVHISGEGLWLKRHFGLATIGRL
ncbi:uncharacterized protein [Spinacia oleracea]|uniref:Reverse transcriptase domain-containing protein n=1 Tax=Spinacia oleracea TaxID=3562 RepID=A0ABM3R8F5_SPIOL|nr:uncharacterized protein LOC130467408 [Spinacia oleracea]